MYKTTLKYFSVKEELDDLGVFSVTYRKDDDTSVIMMLDVDRFLREAGEREIIGKKLQNYEGNSVLWFNTPRHGSNFEVKLITDNETARDILGGK